MQGQRKRAAGRPLGGAQDCRDREKTAWLKPATPNRLQAQPVGCLVIGQRGGGGRGVGSSGDVLEKRHGAREGEYRHNELRGLDYGGPASTPPDRRPHSRQVG